MIEPYKKIYTVREAAQVLLVNEDTMRGFIRRGEFIALKLGSLKIRGTDLEAFIDKYPAYNPEITESRTEG